jgi:hypothetical protein
MSAQKIRSLASVVLLGLMVLLALGSGKTPEQESKSVKSESPAIEVAAPKLFADYNANEIAADDKYKGRVLVVSGTVEDLGKDIMDQMYLTLKTDDVIKSVQAFFAAEHKSRLASMKKGDSVRVKCRCDGKFGNVILKDCSLM